MEHEAFHVDHLPLRQRLAWRGLAAIINFAGARVDVSQI
jgi:hypothetical protein